MGSVEAIEATMAEARRARLRGDLVAAVQWLVDAHEASTSLPDDHSMRIVTGWRLAKAHFDAGVLNEAESVLQQVLELPEPFAAAGGGLRAAEPLARGIWDKLGYGRGSVRRLWSRYIDHWSAAGDPWMVACGRTQLLWDQACAGDLQEVRRAVEAIACTTPRQWRGGASRHPEAADAPASLFFAQMDQARTAARAGVWAEDAGLAEVALELYADALAEAEMREDYWFVETTARAELRFGWPREVAGRWREAAEALKHPRAGFHRALAAAELDRPRAVEHLGGRVERADAAGPEWGVDVRRLLVDHAPPGEPRVHAWRREAEERSNRFGLGVFERPGKRSASGSQVG